MKDFLNKLFHRRAAPLKPAQETENSESPACCSDQVHIVYRGMSDDRLYVSYDRQWREVKFFRPYGLRVFCPVCRRRIL